MPAEGKIDVTPEFWSNMAAERIYGSMEKVRLSAESLKQVIVWVFGVYSSITFATVIWGKKEDWDPWALLLVGLGFMLLIYSYFKCSIANFPAQQRLRPGEQDDIKKKHSAMVALAYSRLVWALRFCTLGILFYCAGILIQFAKPAYSLFGHKKPEVKAAAPAFGPDSLAVAYHLDEKRPVLHLKLNSKKNTWVKVKLEWDTLIKQQLFSYSVYGEKDVKNHENWVLVEKTGVQQFSIPYIRHKRLFVSVSRVDTLGAGKGVKSFGIRSPVQFPQVEKK